MYSLFWTPELSKLKDLYIANISEIEVRCVKYDKDFVSFVKIAREELNDSKLRIMADCSSMSSKEIIKFIPMFKELDVVMGLNFEHELLRNTPNELITDDGSCIWEGLKFQIMDIIQDLDTLLTVINSFEIQKPNAVHVGEELASYLSKKPRLIDGLHAFGTKIKITANKGKRFFVLPREIELVKHKFDLIQLIPSPINPSTISYNTLLKFYVDKDFTDNISLIIHEAPEFIEESLPPIYHLRWNCPISCDDCKICELCEKTAKNLQEQNKIWRK